MYVGRLAALGLRTMHGWHQTCASRRVKKLVWRQKCGSANLVGEGGHYLNRPGELRGGVLDLIRAHRDWLEQFVRSRCPE
jgi:hypothetical protein